MCGIAGIISTQNNFVQEFQLNKMAQTLEHRAPDAEGFWINETKNIAFEHRRLSILDLHSSANQPFHYLHFTIVYNGEIYNYVEIKEFLITKGYSFSTQSDTEVILAAYHFWGKDCLHEFDGMFSFVIYDKQQKEIFIARDRFGEKPFYYFLQRENQHTHFYFASEMKALWAIGINKEIYHQQMLNYLTLGFTSNPINPSQTFYKNIASLPPAHCITIDLCNNIISQKKWYTLDKDRRVDSQKVRKNNFLIDEFSNLFQTSIQRRLRSDVSVGTSLSGGIDSSSIIAYIHQLDENNNYHPTTFTASFPNFEQDETQYSKAVATYFNLKQHCIIPTADQLVESFDQLMYHQEEPLQSSSVFTQFLVYQLAKEKNISVLLDGQGADETLGGYKKYVPWFLQELLANNLFQFKKEKALLKTNQFLEQWNFKNYFAAFLPHITTDQLTKKAINIQSQFQYIEKDYLLQHQNKSTLQKPHIASLNDMLHFNTVHFGLEELLRYADRNSMAHGREVRLPFLSHALVEFVFSLPSKYKIKNGYTKWILREAVKDKLPAEIVWRKGKIGYEPPQQQWLQHPALKEKIMQSRKKLVEHHIFHPSILKTPIQAASTHDANNLDWRILCAAAIIK